MAKVSRVWQREWIRSRAAGASLDVVVIDYLNKAELTPKALKDYGLFGARGRDSEIVKQMAESTGAVCFLVQQEQIDGLPYETRQSAQKSQVWISLERERLDDYSLSNAGSVIVKNANMGSTGSLRAYFDARWMIWGEG